MNIIRKAVPYTLIVVALGLCFLKLSEIDSYRVGDGGEYYALYYAWHDSIRPWMTSQSYAAYQVFIDHSRIQGHVSSEWLAHAFPALRVSDSSDFNHFWFYSLLAAGVSTPFHLAGWSFDAHSSFLLLHFSLTLAPLVVLYRFYGWHGLAAAVLMTFLSPVLWYLNKVHTELFTFTLSLLAVGLVFKSYYLAGAFFLAAVSTQNPSYALVAFVPFFYRIVIFRHEDFALSEIIFAVGTALLVLVHPAYYFFRYGVATPQLLAGGASLGGNLENFYVWLIDPDLGLFPYWPLGLFFVATGLVLGVVKKSVFSRSSGSHIAFFFFFVAAYILINFYAHSSTTNLNSGATRGPARYALWYLPIIFPLIYFVILELAKRKFWHVPFVIVLVSAGWFNFLLSDPRKNEDYSTPSYLSLFVQTHLSGLYSPPDEVFAERYSGYGEAIHAFRPLAILGPDCKKMLIFPEGERALVVTPRSCFRDASKLRDIVRPMAVGRKNQYPFYIYLTKQQSADSIRRLVPGGYTLGARGNGNFILANGWSGLEDFGVWSEGEFARLSLPCGKEHYYHSQDLFFLDILVRPFGVQEVVVSHGGAVIFDEQISAERLVSLKLRPDKCVNPKIDIDFHIKRPQSPLEAGISGDSRKLGVALLQFDLR